MKIEMCDGTAFLTPETKDDKEWLEVILIKGLQVTSVCAMSSKVVGFVRSVLDEAYLYVGISPKEEDENLAT